MLEEENFNLNGSNQRRTSFNIPSEGRAVHFLTTHSGGFIDTPQKATGVLIVAAILMLTITAVLLSQSKPEIKIDPLTGYPVNTYINPGYR
jgi:hypothetical protein